MLEHHQLLLGPWVPGPPARVGEPSPSRRLVIEAVTRERLGEVWWRPDPVPRWLAWLAQPVLTAYETEDTSLLFTVRRVWGPGSRWRVADADDRLVGRFGRAGRRRRGVPVTWVADPSDRRFARFDPGPEEESGRFVSADREVLATFQAVADGHVLAFAPRSEGNPFMRMLLLAAVLRWE